MIWRIKFYIKEISERGISYFIVARIRKNIVDKVSFFYYSLLSRTFLCDSKEYHYFCHFYNATWKNERTVEIPLIWNVVKTAPPENTLELGNVLSHYFPVTHDIVDKYEQAPNVINEDIITWNPKKKYELIVSISTIEHIGWDEKKRDRNKIPKAIQQMRKMLTPNGKIVFTIPLGYNSYLDELIKKKQLPFHETYYLKRISKRNDWEQSSWSDIKNALYGRPYPNANAIIFGVIKK